MTVLLLNPTDVRARAAWIQTLVVRHAYGRFMRRQGAGRGLRAAIAASRMRPA